MSEREEVQAVYLATRKLCNKDTGTLVDYLKWLKEEKGVHVIEYLLELELTTFETGYLKQLIKEDKND